MDSRELRIGNLVSWNSEVAIVSQLLEKDVFFKCGETDLYDAINPILLTEKWLLNFGFVLYGKEATDSTSPSDWYFIKKGFKFQIDNMSHLNSVLGVKIKNVHQLQNLYFALIGEELTFKNQE